MRRRLLAIIALFGGSVPAHAFCFYRGVDNATTTIAQEFRDSRYVVEATVLSGTVGYADDPDRTFIKRWGIDGGNAYRLRVVRALKESPPATIRFFSDLDRGRFVFEQSWIDRAPRGASEAFYVGPDRAVERGRQYLLFLNRRQWHARMGAEERGAVLVNYECGQSKPWHEVSKQQKRLLQQLALQR